MVKLKKIYHEYSIRKNNIHNDCLLSFSVSTMVNLTNLCFLLSFNIFIVNLTFLCFARKNKSANLTLYVCNDTINLRRDIYGY